MKGILKHVDSPAAKTLWRAYYHLNQTSAPNWSAADIHALNILLDALRAVKGGH